MGEGLFVPLGFFATIAAIVIVPRYFRSLERRKLQDTLRAAVERGHSVPPEVLEAVSRDLRPVPSPQRDLRLGILWLAGGIGVACLGVLVGTRHPDALYPTVGVAAVPVFIGLAFILISVMSRRG